MPNEGQDDLYDLAPDTAAAPPKIVGTYVPPPPRVASPPTPRPPRLSPTAAGAAATAKPVDPEALKSFYLPLWLLAGGVAIHVVAAMLGRPTFDAALREVGLGLIVGTATMLGGMLIAAKFRGIDLGPLGPAAMKLAAICIAPAAVVLLLTPALRVIPFGGLLGFAGEFVLYFALLGVMFDLDESDTWYCVCVIFLVRLGVYFGLLAINAHFA